MNSKLSGWDDTIVALSTPPGIGAIGVIRISGEKSFEIIGKLFPSKDLSTQSTHTLHHGILKDDDIILDDVVVSLFKKPKSYTGEDVIEVSCHGSPYIQQQIIEAISKNGARIAKPGEFTQRAFLNGKLDLAQAEAVADLIASNTEASKQAAINNIRGGFSRDLMELREKLIRFSSLIELELDFSEEDVEFADRTEFIKVVEEIEAQSTILLHSFKLGNVIRNGVSVAIVGKPNAGKSTLLNTLLNEDRAIVSEIPGTTRDTIEEVLNIDGILFRLIDTAGIRSHTTDEIESKGISRSLEKIERADIVVYLFDITQTSIEDLGAVIIDLESKQKPFILAANKNDLVEDIHIKEKFKQLPSLLFISGKDNTGIIKLKEELSEKAIGNEKIIGSTIVTNARHYEALKHMVDAVQAIKAGLLSKIPGDLLSIEIRRCLHYLGEITGEITNEDRLDWIFSKFCIGK